MKKILTLIFTMLFTLSSLSIYAAQYTDISDFTDVTELATSFAAAGESVWYSAGSATDKTLSAEDGMLKSVVTGSITDNSGKYFRFANSKGRYTTDGEVLFSFDFMFEETRSVNEGLAWVKYDGKWGVIDIEKTMSGEEDNKKDDSINNEETTKVIEETISNTETTENNTKNPQTGDKNVYSLMMFMMFTIGIVTVIIMLNLKKKEE